MINSFFKLSIVAVLVSVPKVFATADAADRMDRCNRGLLTHVQRENLAQQRWTEFPSLVKNLERAAVLIQIPLETVTVSLTSLLETLQSTGDLTIPDELRIVHDNSLYFVAEGTPKGLNELHDRLVAALPKIKPEFQLLNAKATSFRLETPKTFVHATLTRTSAEKVAAEKAVAAEMENGKTFALYLVDSGQVVFFSPRQPLEKLFESDLLEKEKIQVKRLRKDPVGWSAWVHQRASDFEKRFLVEGPDWVILSPSAFHAIQQIENSLFYSRPSPVSLKGDMQESLRRCFGTTCDYLTFPSQRRTDVTTELPSQEIGNNLTQAGIKQIYSFLKTHKKSTLPLTAPGGIRRSWLGIAWMIKRNADRKDFRITIRSMGISDYEYNNLASGQSTMAKSRFALSWLEFLKANRLEIPDEPLSLKSIKLSIEQLESRLEN